VDRVCLSWAVLVFWVISRAWRICSSFKETELTEILAFAQEGWRGGGGYQVFVNGIHWTVASGASSSGNPNLSVHNIIFTAYLVSVSYLSIL